MKQTRVLFVCTGNAGRSRIAEALFRHMAGDGVSVSSAGVAPWDNVHPVAKRLLGERGIEIGTRKPRHVSSVTDEKFNIVVTIGDAALAGTPELRGNQRRIHWAIPDPADADRAGPDAQAAAFRSAIAAIESRLPDLKALAFTATSAADLHLAPGISTMCVIPSFERPLFDPALHMPLLAKAGFKSLELGCYFGSAHFPWDQADRVNELARMASDNGMCFNSIHSPGAWITVPEARQRRFMIDLARAAADAAAILGARVVVIHAGLPDGMERAATEAALHEALATLEQHALAMPCTFGWENEAVGLTAAEHLQWIRKFNPGAIGFVLDAGHANLQHDLDAYLELAGLRLVALHLQDNHGEADEHVLPGMGTIRWEECMRGIMKAGYVGPLTVESFDFKRAGNLSAYLHDARQAADRLRGYALAHE